MDINKIPEYVLDALRERGNSDDEIKKMSGDKAFEEFCAWYGFYDWASTLRNALDRLRAAE